MAKAIVHPSAVIDDGALLGEDCRVWHFSHISGGARIGARCSFGQNVFVGNDVSIGENVRVQNNVSVFDAVTLEDDVFCGPSVVFTNVYNPRAAVRRSTGARLSGAERRWVPTPRSCVERPSVATRLSVRAPLSIAMSVTLPWWLVFLPGRLDG
jgi:NDP-sugar pyrophosphorylase family protein